MKKRALLIIFLITTVIFGSFNSSYAETNSYQESKKTILATEWMKYLPDNAPVLELNLPGTHNTACCYFRNVPYKYNGFITISTGAINKYGKTQSLSIPQQLDAGTRFLDCRIALVESVDKNNLVVPHNMLVTADKNDNGAVMKIDTIVAYAEQFVTKHPSETVILASDKDGRTYDTSSDKFLELEKKLYSSFENNEKRVLLKTGEQSPTIKELRGKVVLIDADSFGAFGGDSAMDADGKWKTVKEFMDGAPIQDYNARNSVRRSNPIQRTDRPIDLNTSSRGEIDQEGDLRGMGIPYPDKNAKIMNDYLMKYNFVEGKFYGWFLMDYVSEGLNRKIFSSNIFEENKLANKLINDVKATKVGKVSLKTKKKRITISWNRPSGVTPSKYYIYRSKYKSKKYKRIKIVTTQTLRYVDKKGLKKGKRYYYKIIATKKIGTKYYNTKASTIKSIKCK